MGYTQPHDQVAPTRCPELIGWLSMLGEQNKGSVSPVVNVVQAVRNVTAYVLSPKTVVGHKGWGGVGWDGVGWGGEELRHWKYEKYRSCLLAFCCNALF